MTRHIVSIRPSEATVGNPVITISERQELQGLWAELRGDLPPGRVSSYECCESSST